jgi:hypothetical protein
MRAALLVGLVFAGVTAGALVLRGQEASSGTALPPPPDPNAPPAIPEGFTPIFNGTDLTGWHVSRTNHHGTTPDYRVLHGVIVGTQSPIGKGGILLTDRKYRNVEVYIEVKPDWGCDSGLFLRSNEAGQAYQVMLDYLPNGAMGGIYGERLTGVGGSGGGAQATPEERAKRLEALRLRNAVWQKAWKREAWNSIRARITGDVPQITVWINGQLITEFTDTANHAADGATDGHIAIQVHGGDRWVPGGFFRWRAIAVKELP